MTNNKEGTATWVKFNDFSAMRKFCSGHVFTNNVVIKGEHLAL